MSSPPRVPLPRSTERLVKFNKHPGLMLDKYAASDLPGDDSGKLSELVQKPTVKRVVALSRDEFSVYPSLFQRHDRMLEALNAITFDGRTVGSRTLHLARASALENAGICLHQVYGFGYLPGTGLKGMARAYAETVWFPTQYAADEKGQPATDVERQKAADAWQTIEDVFGWSPGSDRGKTWKPKTLTTRDTDAGAASGRIVFHDAWPLEWPRLIEDIVNCHFPKYYQGKASPGDWDSPVPVYFLAVAADQEFRFALSKRSDIVANERLSLARQWLISALTTLGAGAKTNAGYGTFAFEQADQEIIEAANHDWAEATRTARRADGIAQVRLATPAFLAGAEQFEDPQASEGCDLRPATLRGLLRWWWRTLHAGFLDVPTLRRLEAAIWGDTSAAGAVRIVIEPIGKPRVQAFNYKDHFRPIWSFKQEHQLGDPPAGGKTTQGLFYASYGMDEQDRHRFYVEPGAQWSIRLMATNAKYENSDKGQKSQTVDVPAPTALKQAAAALWLLCHFGACGSKARKGFGSLMLESAEFAFDNVDACRFAAAELRQGLKLANQFSEQRVESSALGEPGKSWHTTIAVEVPSPDAWQVMDHVGFAYQAVAQHWKHNRVKRGLGLPRKIHGPRREPMRHQDRAGWQRDQTLRSEVPQQMGKNDRYASPVWIHVERTPQGHRVRAVGLPAPYLPDLQKSREFLSEFLDRFKEELDQPLRKSTAPRGGFQGPRGSQRARPSAPSASTPSSARGSTPLKSGDIVEAELLPVKTKKGGWRVKHAGGGIEGAIVNSQDVPEDKSAGDRVQVVVNSPNPQNASFRYLTDEARKKREEKHHKKQKEGRRPGRRH